MTVVCLQNHNLVQIKVCHMLPSPVVGDPELLGMPEVPATLELTSSPQQGIAGPLESHHK